MSKWYWSGCYWQCCHLPSREGRRINWNAVGGVVVLLILMASCFVDGYLGG